MRTHRNGIGEAVVNRIEADPKRGIGVAPRNGIRVALIRAVAVVGFCSIALPAFAADEDSDGPGRSLAATATVGSAGAQPVGMGARGGEPVYNNCEAAPVDDVGTSECLVYHGDVTGATETCDAPFSEGETWHAFNLLQAGDVVISHCGTDPAFGSAFFTINPECPCDSQFFATDVEQGSCGDGNWTILYPAVPAGDYWTPVKFDPSTGNVGPHTWNICTRGGAASGQLRR